MRGIASSPAGRLHPAASAGAGGRPTRSPPQPQAVTPPQEAAGPPSSKVMPATPPPPPPTLHSRRAVLLASASLASLLVTATTGAGPAAAGGLSKYVKRRGRADPLSSFVPPVMDARTQLARLGEAFGDPAEARRLLRSGAFEGLRDNVRAVGEYAVAAAAAAGGGGGGAPASTTGADRLAPDFFAAVQALDFVFFKAARDGVPVPTGDAQARLDAAVGALDALLATVPADVLSGARVVAEATAGGGGSGGGASASAALAQVLPEAVGV